MFNIWSKTAPPNPTQTWMTVNQMSESEMSQFFNNTFTFFGFALLLSAIWAFSWLYLSTFIPVIAIMIIAFIIEIVLIVTAWKWSTTNDAKAVWLFSLFAFVSWLTLLWIAWMALSSAIWMTIVVNAFLSSAGLFVAMWLLGYITKMNLYKIWPLLLFSLVVLIIVQVINIFIGSSMMAMIASSAWILIFSLYTAYDIQNIKNWVYPSPIFAALALYLDFINIFVHMVQLMTYLASWE